MMKDRTVSVFEGLSYGTLVREIDKTGKEHGPFMVIYSTYSSKGSVEYASAIEVNTQGEEPVLGSKMKIYPEQRLKFVGTFAIEEDDKYWPMYRDMVNERFGVFSR